MDLQPLADLVSRQAADLEVYAGFLFTALDGALPPEYLQVERRSSMMGRFRGKQPEVLAVSVKLGESRFTLRRKGVGAQTQSTVAHEVGGIVLSTKPVPLSEWSVQLAQALQQLAQGNDAAAVALQRLTNFTV